jgi:hypothetical protein
MTGKKKTSKKTTTTTGKDIAVPSFIDTEDKRGDENVTNEDILIPRLELAQALSACVKKKDPLYIEGIEVGDFYNSLTREIYGEEAFFVPVLFEKLYAVWIDRDSGGGFRGMYATTEEAQVVSDEEEKLSEVVDTGMHYGLVVNGDNVEQVTIPMSRSKMKPSRNLNSLCRMTPGPRFAQIYRFGSYENDGAKGAYMDFTVEMVRTMAEEDRELYESAEALYEVVNAGRAKMHDDDIKGADGEGESGEY